MVETRRETKETTMTTYTLICLSIAVVAGLVNTAWDVAGYLVERREWLR
jgi:hypothetical protein